MAVSARFVADFTNFTRAVEQAQLKLRAFDDGAERVNKTLSRVGDTFSGRRILQDATVATKAIEELGGASRLTASEKARLNAQLSEALEKYRVLGQTAPKGMVDLERATRSAADSSNVFSRSAVAVGTAIGSFVGNLAVQGLQQVAQGLATAASNGAKFSALSGSFERLAASIGSTGSEMLAVSRTATKGLVSDLDLIQSTNKAVLLGLPVTAQEMGDLSKAAVTLGRAMGQDATKSLDDLITALGRSSPLILDNLGLTVKVGEANETYAASLGKTVTQLTDAEKKQAFYTAAMEAARRKTDELGEVQLGVIDQLGRLATAAGNVVTRFAASANESTGLSSALGAVADMAEQAAARMQLLADAQARVKSTLTVGDVMPTPYGMPDVNGGGAVEAMAQQLALQRALAAAAGSLPATTRIDPKDPGASIRPAFPTEDEIKRIETGSKRIATSAQAATVAQQKMADAMRAARHIAIDMSVAYNFVPLSISASIEATDQFIPQLATASAGMGRARTSTEALRLALMGLPPELERATVAASRANGPIGSLFQGITSGLSDLWKGMSGGGGISGLLNNLGGSLVQGFGNILSGGLSSLINKGLSAAISGVGKLFGGLFDREGKRVNDLRDQYIAAQGGFQALAEKAVQAGTSIDQLLAVKKVADFQAAVEALNGKLAEFAESQSEQTQRLQDEADAAAAKSAGTFSTLTNEIDILQAKIANNESIQRMEAEFAKLREKGQYDINVILRETRMLQESLGNTDAVLQLQQAIAQAAQSGIWDMEALTAAVLAMKAQMATPILIPIGLAGRPGMPGGDSGGGSSDGGGYLTPSEAAERGVPYYDQSYFSYSDSAYRATRASSYDSEGNYLTPSEQAELGIPNSSKGKNQDNFPGYATGTAGRYLDFRGGTAVTLHGKERVMTASEGAAQADLTRDILVELRQMRQLFSAFPKQIIAAAQTAV